MISVIIPTFNRPGATQAAVRSVRNQQGLTCPVEIIVVDDASDTSPPKELVDDNFKLIRQPVNRGPAAARNAGVLASSHELVAFLDSDDRWLPAKLSAQLAAYEALGLSTGDRDKVVMACGFVLPNRRTGKIEARTPAPGTSIEAFASGCWHCPGSTFLAHRSVFDRVGPFDERLRRLEDVDWFLRFGIAGGRLLVCQRPAAAIRPSGGVRTADLMPALQLLREKIASGPFSTLTTGQKRLLEAYLYAEETLALAREDRWLAAGGTLAKSFLLKPRIRLPVHGPQNGKAMSDPSMDRLFEEMASEAGTVLRDAMTCRP